MRTSSAASGAHLDGSSSAREPLRGSCHWFGRRSASHSQRVCRLTADPALTQGPGAPPAPRRTPRRSEEHTSELQSPCNLVCRLLLEKKKRTHYTVSGLVRDINKTRVEVKYQLIQTLSMTITSPQDLYVLIHCVDLTLNERAPHMSPA